MTYYWSHFEGAQPSMKDGRNLVIWNPMPRLMTGNFLELSAYLSQPLPHPTRTYPDGSPVDTNDAKKMNPAFSGAIYPPNTRRSDANIHAHSLFILDIDNKDPIHQLKLSKLAQIINATGKKAIIYTSWSHSEDNHKCRVVFPLAQPYHSSVHEHYYEWALDHLGLRPWASSIDRGTCVKKQQVYFFGPSWNHEGLFAVQDGEDLEVPAADVLLGIRLPPPITRQSSAAVWGGNDLPFQATSDDWFKKYQVDFTTFDLLRAMQYMGVRIGHPQRAEEGVKYRCHCPWPNGDGGKIEGHSRGVDKDDAFLTMKPGKYPAFHCSHETHRELGLKDICAWMGAAVVSQFAQPRQTLKSAPKGWSAFD